jgi:hypothetical protein
MGEGSLQSKWAVDALRGPAQCLWLFRGSGGRQNAVVVMVQRPWAVKNQVMTGGHGSGRWRRVNTAPSSQASGAGSGQRTRARELQRGVNANVYSVYPVSIADAGQNIAAEDVDGRPKLWVHGCNYT